MPVPRVSIVESRPPAPGGDTADVVVDPPGQQADRGGVELRDDLVGQIVTTRGDEWLSMPCSPHNACETRWLRYGIPQVTGQSSAVPLQFQCCPPPPCRRRRAVGSVSAWNRTRPSSDTRAYLARLRTDVCPDTPTGPHGMVGHPGRGARRRHRHLELCAGGGRVHQRRRLAARRWCSTASRTGTIPPRWWSPSGALTASAGTFTAFRRPSGSVGTAPLGIGLLTAARPPATGWSIPTAGSG